MNDSPQIKDLAETHAQAFIETRSWSAQELSNLLDSPFVFLCGDARCFALIRVVAGEAELLTLATHPNHQRKGLARQIMQDWQTQAQSRGAECAFLEVAADNEAALALYRAQGFAECGKRAGYYARKDGVSVDAVLMRRAFSTIL